MKCLVLCYLLLLFIGAAQVSAAINPTDLSILGAFYTSINHQSSPLSWDTTSDLCSVKNAGLFNLVPAVTCDTNGKVLTLVLPSLSLSGTIPPVLSGLTALKSLILGGNSFSGTLPTQLAALSALESLDFSGNSQINGAIPNVYGSLTSLETLNVGSTGITGQLPTELGLLKNLNTLSVGGAHLTSTIPTEFGQLSSFVNFFGSGAGFFGSIPSQLATATTLEQLILDSNPFLGGSIPTEIGVLTDLGVIDFHSCSFVNLPSQLGNLVNLGILDLSSNNVTGTIPTQLSSMSSLDTLKLSHNQLTGNIPSVLSNLPYIAVLDLSFNQLSGPIPTSLSSLPNIGVLNLVGGNSLCPVFDFSSYAPQTDYSPQNCNSCSPTPCQNGGVCTYTNSIFGCSCAPGFNASDCSNHITCPTNYDGNATWSPTFAQNTAIGTCNALFAGQPTRTCSATGTWGAISNSCISYCLSFSSGHVTWNNAAPNTIAGGVCDNGYSGTPARQCLSSGSWSSSIKSVCYRNTCPAVTENGVYWASANSLNLQTATCPQYFTGSPRRQCLANGQWDVVQQPCVQITCPQANFNSAQWPTTNATLTATGVCFSGYSGSPTRNCSGTGTWSSSVSNPCTQLSCSSEPYGGYTWPTTLALHNVTFACPANNTGSVNRFCNGTGGWEDILNTCVAFCPGYNDSTTSWPTTNAGMPASGTCLPDYTGSPSRQCISAGVWDVIQNPCSPVGCFNDTTSLVGNATWISTPAASIGSGICLPGYFGAPLRTCLANGQWDAVITGCEPYLCQPEVASNISWPLTNAFGVVSLSCPAGFIGVSTRTCGSTGVWSAVVNPCIPQCPNITEGSATWLATNATLSASGTCVGGYYGSPTRQCLFDGTWDVIQNPCTINPCPSDSSSHVGNATWTSTPAGTTVNGTCLTGYSGTATRACLSNSQWSSTAITGCSPLYCAAEVYGHTSFTDTLAGATSNGTCVPGYTGYSLRNCNSKGVWSTSIVFECTLNTCPQVYEGFVTWTKVNNGITEFQYCASGRRSQRTCGIDGTWGPITNACSS